MKNIVLIQHEPLTERLEKIFCIQDLINAGFSIEYWDVSQICNPGIKLPKSINRDYVRIIRDVDEFKKKINILNMDAYICIVEILFSFENPVDFSVKSVGFDLFDDIVDFVIQRCVGFKRFFNFFDRVVYGRMIFVSERLSYVFQRHIRDGL